MRRPGLSTSVAAAAIAVVATAVGVTAWRISAGIRPPENIGAVALAKTDKETRAQPTETGVHEPAQPQSGTAAPLVDAKQGKQQPLPPDGTPLKQISKQLAERAANGDAAAASRLFRDTQECRHAREFLRNTAKQNLEQVFQDEASLDELQHELDRVRRDAALCAGLEEAVDDGRIYSISLRAADLGDEAAACFYVNAPILVDDGRLASPLSDVVGPDIQAPPMRLDAKIVAQYQVNAIRIATQGVERGDWNMVLALQVMYSGGWLVVASPLPAEPLLAYRYYLLWRMGETDPETLQRYAEVPLDTSAFSADAVLAANEWARRTYEDHFSKRLPGPMRDSYYTCAIPPLQGLP